jgi:hypothetical protein
MRVSEFDRIVVGELTRPNNTTTYSSGQVIGAANPAQLLTFPYAGRSVGGATGYIRSIRLLTNQPTCVAAITVWLYNAPPNVVVDGAEFQNLWLERNLCLGSFTMQTLAVSGLSDYALSQTWFDQYNIYACAQTPLATSQNLYAQLVTGTGFTPAANQVFRVELGVHQNELQ